MLSRWVAGVVVLFGILLFMLPRSDEQSLSRIASTSMLACTKELRKEAARQLLNEEAVEVEFKNNCPELIASLEIDGQGEMLVTGNRHPLTLRLHPVMENGKLRWSCHGDPPERVTKLCKP
jgi:hypothetical protein